MTVRQYIEKKNKILLELTGVTLVPEDQIVDIEFNEKMVHRNDSSICPYCVKYEDEDCVDCPMYHAENRCGFRIGSTYGEINCELKDNHDTSICNIVGIKELVKQWNNELNK